MSLPVAPSVPGLRHNVQRRPTRSLTAALPRWDLLSLALMGTLLTYVWRMQDLYPIVAKFKLPILSMGAALALFYMDHDARRKLAGVKHPMTTPLGVIIALAALSVPTSVYPGLSFGFFKGDLGQNFVLFIVLVASIRTFVDVRRFCGALMVGAVIYSTYIFLNVQVDGTGRLGDIVYYDANDVSMLLVCSIPIALFFVTRSKHAIARVASASAIGMFIIVIIKCGSRGGFLGLIAVGLYLLLRFRSISAPVRLSAVIAGSALLLAFGSDTYWEMMSSMLNPKADYNWAGNNDTGRMEIWKRGMGYMFSRPLTGVGAGAFPVAEGTISPLAKRQEFGIGLKWSAAHNSFVQIGAELGVGGLAAFILLLYRAFRTARKERDSGVTPVRAVHPPSAALPPPDEQVLGHALAGSVVGFAVAGFFLSQAYAAFVFVLMALIVGLDKVARVPAGAKPVEKPAQVSAGWRSLRGSVSRRR